MELTEKHKEYWRRNLLVTGVLLAIWFVVTFVEIWFARELNSVTFLGFPLGFYDTLHHLPVVRQATIASAFGVAELLSHVSKIDKSPDLGGGGEFGRFAARSGVDEPQHLLAHPGRHPLLRPNDLRDVAAPVAR